MKEYQYELSEVEHAAWNLIYNMIEAGAEPKRNEWWYEEWHTLKQSILERGLKL